MGRLVKSSTSSTRKTTLKPPKKTRTGAKTLAPTPAPPPTPSSHPPVILAGDESDDVEESSDDALIHMDPPQRVSYETDSSCDDVLDERISTDLDGDGIRLPSPDTPASRTTIGGRVYAKSTCPPRAASMGFRTSRPRGYKLTSPPHLDYSSSRTVCLTPDDCQLSLASSEYAVWGYFLLPLVHHLYAVAVATIEAINSGVETLTSAQMRSIFPEMSASLLYNDHWVWVYLCFEIYIGLMPLRTMTDFWSTSPLYKNVVARKLFPRGRIQFRLLRFLLQGDVNTMTAAFNTQASRMVTPGRDAAPDEGPIPQTGNSESRSFTPGKPHPNHTEYIMLVDSPSLFGLYLCWDKATSDQKYRRPLAMVNLMKEMYLYLDSQWPNRSFRLYLDSRFASCQTLEDARKVFIGVVCSMGGNRKPTDLRKWIKVNAELEVKQWCTVYNAKLGACWTTIRAKRKTYCSLLTNIFDDNATLHQQRRRKAPTSIYYLKAPTVQIMYNRHKCAVDLWNRMWLAYYRPGRYVNDPTMFTRFFVHAFTLQASRWRHVLHDLKRTDHKQFLEAVLERFLDTDTPPRSPRITTSHWPVQLPVPKGKCAKDGCNNKARCYCRCALDLFYCRKHLDDVHNICSAE